VQAGGRQCRQVVVFFKELGTACALAGRTVNTCSPLLSIFSILVYSYKQAVLQNFNVVYYRTKQVRDAQGRRYNSRELARPKMLGVATKAG